MKKFLLLTSIILFLNYKQKSRPLAYGGKSITKQDHKITFELKTFLFKWLWQSIRKIYQDIMAWRYLVQDILDWYSGRGSLMLVSL